MLRIEILRNIAEPIEQSAREFIREIVEPFASALVAVIAAGIFAVWLLGMGVTGG